MQDPNIATQRRLFDFIQRVVSEAVFLKAKSEAGDEESYWDRYLTYHDFLRAQKAQLVSATPETLEQYHVTMLDCQNQMYRFTDLDSGLVWPIRGFFLDAGRMVYVFEQNFI